MITIETKPLRLSEGLSRAAQAKMAAQETKLASMYRLGPQRKIEERLLCAMTQNAFAISLNMAIGMEK